MTNKRDRPVRSIHEVNGTRIQVAELGSGHPLVLLHGWPETSASWRHVMAPLSGAGFRVIAPDLRGLGESRRDPAGYNKENQAEDLAQLLDVLGCDGPVALVGHDIGGMVAFAFARLHPDRISHLVLTELALPGLGLEQAMNVAAGGRWHFGFFMTSEVPELLLDGKEEDFFNWWFRALGSDPAAWHPDHVAAVVESYRGTESLRAGFAHYRTLLDDGIANRAWVDDGHLLTMPVLTIAGEYGGGHQLGPALKPICRHLNSVVLQGSGHFLSEERPRELVTHLRTFLTASTQSMTQQGVGQ